MGRVMLFFIEGRMHRELSEHLALPTDIVRRTQLRVKGKGRGLAGKKGERRLRNFIANAHLSADGTGLFQFSRRKDLYHRMTDRLTVTQYLFFPPQAFFVFGEVCRNPFFELFGQRIERFSVNPPATAACEKSGNGGGASLRSTLQFLFFSIVVDQFTFLDLCRTRSIPPKSGDNLVAILQKLFHPIIRSLENDPICLQSDLDIGPTGLLFQIAIFAKKPTRLIRGDKIQSHQTGIEPPVSPYTKLMSNPVHLLMPFVCRKNILIQPLLIDKHRETLKKEQMRQRFTQNIFPTPTWEDSNIPAFSLTSPLFQQTRRPRPKRNPFPSKSLADSNNRRLVASLKIRETVSRKKYNVNVMC